MKKIYLLLIFIMLLSLSLVGCKSDEPEHQHNYDYSVVFTDPTDTACGYTTHTCECGESYVSEGEKATEGLTYTINADSTYTVTGIYNANSNHIVIPSHYEGLPVSAIADGAFKDTTIVSVFIPSTVSKIGHLALCASLNFEDVEVSANSQHFTAVDGALYSKDTKTLVQYPIGRDDTDFEIPSHVNTIGNGAFCNATSLTSVTIPAGVTGIGAEAFKGCSKITEFKLPESLTSIGDGAFELCYALTTINVPNSVSTIGESAFAYCEKITAINIPNGVTVIGNNTFSHCYQLNSVTLPDTVTSIGDYAFEWCDGLTEVQLSASLQSIGDYAFSNCKKLNYIILPGGLTHLGEWAFSWCESLKSANIPSSIGVIADKAFYMCRDLEEVEIPEGITSIGEMSFYECYDLATISIPSTVTSIGDRAFSGSHALETIKVSIENERFISYGGALYTHDGDTLIQYATGRDATSFTISNSVEKIEREAFTGAANLLEIHFASVSGWMAGDNSIDSEILSNPERAAYYLTENYDYSEWTQTE